jgi:hypothetical protein
MKAHAPQVSIPLTLPRFQIAPWLDGVASVFVMIARSLAELHLPR